ncbi:glycosyltransferase family 2 protein [Candidatus Shapirobacteria bacterium]|nr:glycosyltransferase family 2 protein [Candidatus Shapirobacteria bacterium]
MIKISIIIPTWNTADITLKCVKTIVKYLPENYFEIIIVDNGSTDDTSIKINSLKNRNLKLEILPNNTGFSHANNIGVKQATGEYLFFLNSDMELIDNSLINMVKYLEENTRVGVIGPQFLNIDLSPQASVFPPQTPLNAIKEFWLGYKYSYTKYVPQSKIPTMVSIISGGALLISRKLFQQIGGWDERYFFFSEDLELCRQVTKAGYKVAYYPNCQVIHRHGASGKSLADEANQWRRLVPSSKIYHGLFKHYLLFFITWTRRQWQKLTGY